MDNENTPQIIPVILCGGSGKRLWPLSNHKKPKQFLSLNSNKSLLQETLERAIFCTDTKPSEIIVVTSKKLETQTRNHLLKHHPDATNHLLIEDKSRNTAPAIALAANYAIENFKNNTLLWILPSDHVINDHSKLKQYLQQASLLATNNNIVTFGIKPKWPEIGYGYIKANGNQIESFVEKPNLQKAKEYFKSNEYLWNSGMFLAPTALILKELEKHTPNILNSEQVISFDKAVMEKTDKAAVIQCDLEWSDLGTWRSLWHEKTKKRKAA